MSVNSTYPTARTTEGEIVLANEADRSKDFYCLSCGGQMLLKRGQIRIPHFAHKFIPENCSSETVLHSSFKHLLFRKIDESLKNKEPLLMSWKCKKCYEKHEGNLIKRADSAKLEFSFSKCQPDIALFNNEKPIVFIEVVVTHQPEINVLEFCEENQVILVKFELRNFDDLDRLKTANLDPNHVDCCLKPPPKKKNTEVYQGGYQRSQGKECPNCLDTTLYPKSVRVVVVSCWKCGRDVSLCYAQSYSKVLYGPEYFGEEEFKTLEKFNFLNTNNPHSIQISRFTEGKTGLVKTFCFCRSCNSNQGLNYYFNPKNRSLWKDYELEGGINKILNRKLRDFVFGNYCTNCEYRQYRHKYGWWR